LAAGKASASCNSNEVLIGGGYSFPAQPISTGNTVQDNDPIVSKNGPNGKNWEIEFKGLVHGGSPGIVYAICATISAEEDTNSSP
jgi:hypothetical protein